MDGKDVEINGLRTRSFRYEDKTNRRAFLRSYPLHWGAEEESQDEEMTRVNDHDYQKKPAMKIILSVFQWGEGKFLVFRRFKNRVKVYAIACIPVALKHPTGLLSS
ncbi:hypothetical protein Tsubulata_017211 [Turnera subulata]|uniref:Uncharacterized protein n=1 Tax=Turnera subulata TaxID=218843 RepID=A0A9Q0FM54_9ROSI|nr:hypothetical protein Tsubulata_017211 [Turnera subulata]